MASDDQPIAADNKPVVLEIEPGTHSWSSCGRSQKQPFCDGSHKTTPFKSVRFEIAQKKEVALCMCKRTQNPPFCDGSHRNLR